MVTVPCGVDWIVGSVEADDARGICDCTRTCAGGAKAAAVTPTRGCRTVPGPWGRVSGPLHSTRVGSTREGAGRGISCTGGFANDSLINVTGDESPSDSFIKSNKYDGGVTAVYTLTPLYSRGVVGDAQRLSEAARRLGVGVLLSDDLSDRGALYPPRVGETNERAGSLVLLRSPLGSLSINLRKLSSSAGSGSTSMFITGD